MRHFDTIAFHSSVADYITTQNIEPTWNNSWSVWNGTVTSGYNRVEFSSVSFPKGSVLEIVMLDGATVAVNTQSSGFYRDYCRDISQIYHPGENYNLFVNLITNKTQEANSVGEATLILSLSHSYNREGTFMLNAGFECNGVKFETNQTIVVSSASTLSSSQSSERPTSPSDQSTTSGDISS